MSFVVTDSCGRLILDAVVCIGKIDTHSQWTQRLLRRDVLAAQFTA